MAATCSCGDAKPHEIAWRLSADGKRVALWSDGAVTGALGFAIRGVGAPCSTYARAKAVEAGRLLLEEVCLYDFVEMGALVKAARRAVVQSLMAPLPFLRRTMAGDRFRFAGRHGAVVVASRDPSKDPHHVNRGTGFMDPGILDRLKVHIIHDRRIAFIRPSAALSKAEGR